MVHCKGFRPCQFGGGPYFLSPVFTSSMKPVLSTMALMLSLTNFSMNEKTSDGLSLDVQKKTLLLEVTHLLLVTLMPEVGQMVLLTRSSF